MCTFLFWIVHCGIWHRCFMGFVNLVYLKDIFNPYHIEFISGKISGLKPRSHCADLAVPISTIWKIVADLYDLENRGHRHGRLMKSWQHRTDILEVCSVGKRSAVIGKPVRQSFTVKLCHVGRDCGYDLLMDRFQSCVESETLWDCHTQREGIRGQRVGIRGQRTNGCEDRTNITIASCLIGVTFTFQYVSRCAYISVYISLSFKHMSILMSWGRQ